MNDVQSMKCVQAHHMQQATTEKLQIWTIEPLQHRQE